MLIRPIERTPEKSFSKERGPFPSSSIVMSIPRNGLNQVGGALEILFSEENRKKKRKRNNNTVVRLCNDDFTFDVLDFRVM